VKSEKEMLADQQYEDLDARGLPIEAGWVSYCSDRVSEKASAPQRDDMREAFFAGASYTIARLMAEVGMDNGQPTKAGLKLAKAINRELEAFTLLLMADDAASRDITVLEVAMFDGTKAEDLGLLLTWLNPNDPRPAREQFDENYQHGGGWRPFGEGQWTLGMDCLLTYPGDPPYKPIAGIKFRKEMVLFYRHSLVAIRQLDGTFEVARMD